VLPQLADGDALLLAVGIILVGAAFREGAELAPEVAAQPSCRTPSICIQA